MTANQTQAFLLDALSEAESFISGFEGDDTQDGVDELLHRIRSSIAAANAEAALPTPILAIVIEGGCISDIVSNRPELFANVDVLTIDYDVEGIEEDRLIAILQPSGGAEFPSEDAFVRDQSVDRAKIDLAAVATALDAREAAKAED